MPLSEDEYEWEDWCVFWVNIFSVFFFCVCEPFPQMTWYKSFLSTQGFLSFQHQHLIWQYEIRRWADTLAALLLHSRRVEIAIKAHLIWRHASFLWFWLNIHFRLRLNHFELFLTSVVVVAADERLGLSEDSISDHDEALCGMRNFIFSDQSQFGN